MAITKTSTGSQWHIWEGTSEELANSMMISGIGTGHKPQFTGQGVVGSYAVMINANGLPR